MKVILSILFIGWGLFVIVITKRINKKVYELEEGIRIEEIKKWRKKLMKNHLTKIFISLLIVLIIVLILVFLDYQFK